MDNAITTFRNVFRMPGVGIGVKIFTYQIVVPGGGTGLMLRSSTFYVRGESTIVIILD